MRLIESSYEIIPQAPGLDGIYKQIELAARNCYKSESFIKEGSAERMINALIQRGHGSPLEHGTVYLFIPLHTDKDVYNIIKRFENNHYSKVKIRNEHFLLDKNGYYITSNYRVLVENDWLECLKYLCEPTEWHEKRHTVRFVCSRSISHKFLWLNKVIY